MIDFSRHPNSAEFWVWRHLLDMPNAIPSSADFAELQKLLEPRERTELETQQQDLLLRFEQGEQLSVSDFVPFATACRAVVEVEGAWEVNGVAPDLEAVFKDASGKPVGFALTGTATAKRAQYVPLMPPVYEPAA